MKHSVTFGLSDHELGREEKGVSFVVKQDGKAAGSLLVSKGAIRWYSKGNSKTNYELNWTKFAEMMEANGSKTK